MSAAPSVRSALQALDEALAVNRLLVWQATMNSDFPTEMERYRLLAQLETERLELKMGHRVLKSFEDNGFSAKKTGFSTKEAGLSTDLLVIPRPEQGETVA